jgi:chemotaxis protein MotA
MNIFSLIGALIGIGFLLTGMRLSTDNLTTFYDFPSIFIVLGGTFAAISMSYQLDRLILLFKIFLSHFLGGGRIKFTEVIKNIMQIAESYRNGEPMESLSGKARDPFLREALALIGDGIMEEEHILRLLDERANNMNYMRQEDAGKIKSVGKYPPAFGMIGTTMGMVVLLGNLGGEDAMAKMGPAMAVALMTTLYGSIVANLCFIPMGDNLVESAKETHLKNVIILSGVKHILARSNPIILVEELNSFLLPKERLDWKAVK